MDREKDGFCRYKSIGEGADEIATCESEALVVCYIIRSPRLIRLTVQSPAFIILTTCTQDQDTHVNQSANLTELFRAVTSTGFRAKIPADLLVGYVNRSSLLL